MATMPRARNVKKCIGQYEKLVTLPVFNLFFMATEVGAFIPTILAGIDSECLLPSVCGYPVGPREKWDRPCFFPLPYTDMKPIRVSGVHMMTRLSEEGWEANHRLVHGSDVFR
jgi:hypothetical protein